MVNILTLLILIWSSRISPTNNPLSLHNFTEPEKQQIITTLKELNVYQKRTLTIRKKELDPFVLGITYVQYLECYIELSPCLFYGLTKTHFKPTLYHEIGHCFGLEHSENKNDIMYHEAKSINSYSPLDWEQFHRQLKKVMVY